MNAVTCTQWVKRGVAKQKPDQVKLNEHDLKELIANVQNASLQDSDGEIDKNSDERKRKVPMRKSDDKDEDEDKSDESENEEEMEGDDASSGSEEGEAANPLSFASVAYYGSNAEDPNLVPDIEDSDEEDLNILDDDNLIAVGRVKKDFCSLGVYVYNEKTNSCFCHHDIILPTIPLCLEWLNYDGTEEKPGNLLAVGSVSPDIEIWDLDIVNSLEPTFTLAGHDSSLKKKKKKKGACGHSDAVLSLSWNTEYKHALASGSADESAALWDLGEMAVVATLPHPDKVQSVQWQPSHPQALLTGCADATVNLFDCRSLPPSKTTWKVDGEVEQVVWDAKNSNFFLAGTDAGSLYYFDIRAKKPLFQSIAHPNGISGITQSAGLPECVVTSGTDKYVKVWSIANAQLKEVYTKKMNMGQLFGVSSCPDSPLLLVVAGEEEFRVLNLAKNPDIPAAFGSAPAKHKDGVLNSDDIEVPIGHADFEDNQSEQSSEGEEPMAAAAAPVTQSKKQRKKKKAKRKLAQGPAAENTPSESTTTNGDALAAAPAQHSDITSTSETRVVKKKSKKKKKKKVDTSNS